MIKYLRTALLALIAVGAVGLIFIKDIRNALIDRRGDTYRVENVTKETMAENQTAEVSYDFEAVTPPDTSQILLGDATGLPVIAGIAIPDVGINLPIFKGLGNTEIAYGAGTMKPEQKLGEGNYALASHHIFGTVGASEQLFSPLERAEAGMKIYVTDKENIYTYIVRTVERVEPTRVEVVDDVPGKRLITLVTCTDFNETGRIIVQGELISVKEWDKAPAKEKTPFSGAYNQVV